NALVAVIASIVIFGAMHAYQGIGGIIGTTIFGAIMMFIFLATGTILWPILLHAVFDLRSLVLIPIAVYKVHRVAEGEEKVAQESIVEDSPAPEVVEATEAFEADQQS
ncbi:MAG: CPBP family intramembrane metalloprotease, partial [Microbacteriaceae bacterium]|nr:CPBP family intramembrane metalloprotease [Microbacteriaceae bacterium]